MLWNSESPKSAMFIMSHKSNGHIYTYDVGVSRGPFLLGQCDYFPFWHNWDEHNLFATQTLLLNDDTSSNPSYEESIVAAAKKLLVIRYHEETTS